MAFGWPDLLRSIVDGKYFLKQFVSEEGTTGVFDADASDGSPVTVRLSSDADVISAWADRTRISASLAHPNLLRDLDSGETRIDGQRFSYLASEPIEEQLDEVLTERVLTPDETHAVVHAVLTALEHLHQHGYVHGSISPSAIVAAQGAIKLKTTTAKLSPAADGDRLRAAATDIQALAHTTAQLLTRQRDLAAGPQLSPPFGEFVRASFGTHECPWPSAAQMLRVLNGEPLVSAVPAERTQQHPEPEVVKAVETGPVTEALTPEPTVQRRPWTLIVAAAVIAAIVVALTAFRSDRGGVAGEQNMRETTASAPTRNDSAAAQPSQVPAPVPVATPPSKPQPTTHQPKVRSERPVPAARQGGWGVVAAIYRDHSAATRRAASLASKWKGVKPSVHPAAGEGSRYFVVLGSGMSRAEAEKLRSRARSSGMPRDTYVTKLAF